MIDTKRLATDAAYWDSVAPEGATHYSHLSGEFLHKNDFGKWFRRVGSDWLIHNVGHTNLTERPTKPQAQEWDGEGSPPVGCECEAKNESGEWVAVVVKGFDGHVVWLYEPSAGKYAVCDPSPEFRPIRTKEQRQRDELLRVMGQPSILIDLGAIADAILSRYNLEPKP